VQIIIEEMAVGVEGILVSVAPGMNAQTSPIVRSPRAILDVLDPGGNRLAQGWRTVRAFIAVSGMTS
jgi:hypothetical protein